MANHADSQSGGGARFRVDDAGCICLVVTRDTPAGCEVLLDYGGRSNEEWLLHYGFIPGGTNEHDSVALPAQQCRVGVQSDDDGEGGEGGSDVVYMSWQDVAAISARLHSRGDADSMLELSRSNVAAAARRAGRILKEMPSTLAEDELLLQKLLVADSCKSSAGAAEVGDMETVVDGCTAAR
jgi:hypothetical protein